MATLLTTVGAEFRPVRPDFAKSPVSSDGGDPSHLRRLLEKQPACLLRVARDGTLLACNDAGLNLLGRSDLATVLNRPFEEHLTAEHAPAWREFAERTWTNDAASLECQLVGGDPPGRTVQLQAVALKDHPDAIESMLVAVRDLSADRRLEESIEHGREDRRQLEGSLQAERAAAAQRLTETEAQLERALHDQQELAKRLDESRAEQQQLAAAIHQRDVAIHRRDSEHARAVEGYGAEQARLQQLAEQHRLALLDQDQRATERLNALDQQIAGDQMRHAALATALRDETARAQAERDAALGQFQQALAGGRELQRLLAERDAHLRRTEAERAALAARLEQSETERTSVEHGLRQAEAERAAVEAALRQAEAEREVAATNLELAVAAARDAATHQQEHDQRALAELRSAHEAAAAERQQAAALVEELSEQLRRTAVDHAAVRAELEHALEDARAEAVIQQDRDRRALAQGETRLAQALAEQERLLSLVEQGASELRLLAANQASAGAEIERLAQENERAMAVRDRERSEIIANLQAELALSFADQKRLQTLLSRADADHQRLLTSHTADRAAAERSLGEAASQKSQFVKALADRQVELQQWQETARALEPMATSGRLAVLLARDMHDVVANIDDRAQLLLEVSLLDATYRPQVEALRSDAMRAASFARQLARSNPEPQTTEETP